MFKKFKRGTGGAPSLLCARGGGEGGGGSMLYPGQMGTDLNPTEYAFRKNSGTNGDGVKMFICGHATPTFEHLRPQAPSKMGTPALPRPLLSHRAGRKKVFARGPRMQPQPKIKDFRPGTPTKPHPETRDFVTGTPIFSPSRKSRIFAREPRFTPSPNVQKLNKSNTSPNVQKLDKISPSPYVQKIKRGKRGTGCPVPVCPIGQGERLKGGGGGGDFG